MSEAPETIWVTPEPIEGLEMWDGCPLVDTKHGEGYAFRRADLPATNEQAFANPKVKALVEAVKSAGHYAGMDLARISAALAAMETDDD